MYTRGYDKDHSLLVKLWSGTSNSAADFDRATEDLLALDRDGRAQLDGVVIIAEVDPENSAPNTMERKRIADAVNAATQATKVYFLMVTSSALARGVITAIGWFTPSDARHVNSTHATFDEAVSRAEAYRPGISGRLYELRRIARDEALERARPK